MNFKPSIRQMPLHFYIVGLAIGLLPIIVNPLVGVGLCFGILLLVFILRQPQIGLFLIAATIPLEAAGRISFFTQNLPLTVPKLLTLVTLCAWLINVALLRIPFRRLPWMYYLFAFLCACLASLLGASEVRSGIEAVVRFSSTIIFYFLTIQILKTEKVLKVCLLIFIFCSTLSSSWAIAQRFLPGNTFDFRYGWEEQTARRGGIEVDIVEQDMVGGVVKRSSGVSTHSILLAFNISLILAPLIAFLGMVGRKDVILRIVWLSILAILLASIIVTYARTGFILVLFAFFMMIWKKLIRLSAAKIIGVLVALVIFAAAAPEKYVDRVLSLDAYTSKSASIQIRMDIAKAAIGQFLDHPVLGVGYGNQYGIFDYFTKYPDKEHAVTPHNAYIQVASQTGLVGLTFLLLFFWKSNRALKMAIEYFKNAKNEEMACLGVALQISFFVFLFAGLALDLFDKGLPHAWLIIGAAGAFSLLAEEAKMANHQLRLGSETL